MPNASVNISIHCDPKQVNAIQAEIERQMPFAAASALTKVASRCQREIRRVLPSEMVIRNSWTSRGVQIQRAEKTDWPHCTAIVGSKDVYMIDQETGGEREHAKKSLTVVDKDGSSQTVVNAIPEGIRLSNRAIIKRGQWPVGLLGGDTVRLPMGGRPVGARNGSRRPPQPFIAIPRNNKIGLYVRTGGTYEHNGRSKEKFKLLYRLRTKPVAVKKREWLRRTVDQAKPGPMSPPSASGGASRYTFAV